MAHDHDTSYQDDVARKVHTESKEQRRNLLKFELSSSVLSPERASLLSASESTWMDRRQTDYLNRTSSRPSHGCGLLQHACTQATCLRLSYRSLGPNLDLEDWL